MYDMLNKTITVPKGMGIFSAGNCSTKCNKTFAIIKKNKTGGRERG